MAKTTAVKSSAQADLLDEQADGQGGKRPPTGSSRNVTIVGDDGPGNKKQGWLQSEKVAHDFMWKVGMKNATALPLLHYMVAHCNRGAGGVVVSAQTLARDLGVTPRTIQTAVAILRKCNFIQVLKSGNTNVYVINSQVAWQGKRGFRFATFNASIKVHEEEQEQSVEELITEAEQLVPVPEMHFSGDLRVDVVDMESGVVSQEDMPNNVEPYQAPTSE